MEEVMVPGVRAPTLHGLGECGTKDAVLTDTSRLVWSSVNMTLLCRLVPTGGSAAPAAATDAPSTRRARTNTAWAGRLWYIRS